MFLIADRLPLEQRDANLRRAHERVAAIKAGLKRVPSHIQEAISAFCPELRVRHCFERGKLIIEHYHPQTAWQMIGGGEWREHANGSIYSPQEMIELLKDGDMQRMGHLEYLDRKRRGAIAVQKSNEHSGNERLATVVQSMPDKSVSQFIQVEEAFKTGEAIVPHGQDARTLEVLDSASQKQTTKAGKKAKKAARNDDMAAMNPGQHPLIYQRDKKARTHEVSTDRR